MPETAWTVGNRRKMVGMCVLAVFLLLYLAIRMRIDHIDSTPTDPTHNHKKIPPGRFFRRFNYTKNGNKELNYLAKNGASMQQCIKYMYR